MDPEILQYRGILWILDLDFWLRHKSGLEVSGVRTADEFSLPPGVGVIVFIWTQIRTGTAQLFIALN